MHKVKDVYPDLVNNPFNLLLSQGLMQWIEF